MSDSTQKLVFISHASADAKKAAALCKALESAGIGCWIAPRDIDPGKQYGEEIIHGIESTQGLVLMLSAKSNASPHVRDEAERAKHYNKRVIPLRIDDITPSKSLEFYIATSQWIDAYGGKWADGVDELTAAISRMSGHVPSISTATRTDNKGKIMRKLALAACALVILGIGSWTLTRGDSNQAQDTNPAQGTTLPQDDSSISNTQDNEATRGAHRLPQPQADVHPNHSGLTPKYHALVIGIDTYADHGNQGWDHLKTAARDAMDIARVLNELYGFDVTQLINEAATRANIMQALDIIATSYPDDAILIYYAGHGYYKDDLDQGYWIPSDARRKTADGHEAKQDWVWNSTIQEMLSSTKSKHVLLMADSCFSGALFRGAEEGTWAAKEKQWYRRAIKKDSRYLITSGGLEPVMDGGGGGHSIFARQVLDYLRSDSSNVFSASDLAHSVRTEVNNKAGQRVHMGHLPVRSHEGGEFVFLKRARDLPLAVQAPEQDDMPVLDVSRIHEQIKPRGRTQSQRAAVEMFAQGATNAAINVLASFGDDPFAKALSDQLLLKAKQNRVDGINQLLDSLENRIAAEIADGTHNPEDAKASGRAAALDLWGETTSTTNAAVVDDALFFAEATLLEDGTIITQAQDKVKVILPTTVSEFSDAEAVRNTKASQAGQSLNQAQDAIENATTPSDNSLDEAQGKIDAATREGQAIRDAAANAANKADMENSLGGQLTSGAEQAIQAGVDATGTAVGTAVGQRIARDKHRNDKAAPAVAPPKSRGTAPVSDSPAETPEPTDPKP